MTASTVEKRGFEAEVKQVLHLMINALYSNKEIFLRELISNASDAVDKLRFEGLNNSALYEGNSDLKILVDFDEEAKTITITDNGIGMSREEAIKNLGTIARSGTQEFVKALSGDQAKDSKLIGQFGVGFYSSFIVAQKVVVRTRRAGLSADQGVEWTSEGAGEYTLETINKADRGTQIVLFLKEDEVEFANNYRLRHIITKYSDHIALPIMMKEVKFDSQSAEDSDTKEKNITEPQYEVVNKATALWTVPKSDIKDEEYHELYKHISHDFQEPLTWAHNKVEGKLEYISLLYIPKKAPFDMWNPDRAKGLKLYVQRVFIMDEVEQFLPNYLRFVKGIIDSNDLPLNVSREILQSNRAIDSIRSAVSTRVLGLLETLSKEDSDKYLEFWKEFGQVLKEGPAEDYTNREKIAKLLRFASTLSNTDVQNVSLDDYIARMKEGQETIYYIAAENFNAAKNSPHLELFRQKGVEVLLLSDRIDEWLMSHLSEFGGKKLHSITRGNLDSLEFNQEEAQKSKAETEAKEQVFKDVLDRMKSVLGDKVKDVRITARLTSSPACIVADENAMTSQMERILKAAGQHIDTKPILELNPDHLLIQRLKVETDNARFEDWSKILLDQAILSEGGQLEDPATFVKRFNEMLLQVAK